MEYDLRESGMRPAEALLVMNWVGEEKYDHRTALAGTVAYLVGEGCLKMDKNSSHDIELHQTGKMPKDERRYERECIEAVRTDDVIRFNYSVSEPDLACALKDLGIITMKRKKRGRKILGKELPYKAFGKDIPGLRKCETKNYWTDKKEPVIKSLIELRDEIIYCAGEGSLNKYESYMAYAFPSLNLKGVKTELPDHLDYYISLACYNAAVARSTTIAACAAASMMR